MAEGGGPDPKFNVQLSSIIAHAKKCSMPLASIQSAMKQDKDTKSSTKACYFEVRGPGGCTIILSTLTDNRNRMKVTLNSCVKKYNSTFTEGAIRGLFDHKGFIEAIPPEKTSLETSVEHAIEAGAEDVVELEDAEDNVLQFICSPAVLNQVRGKLEKLQYNIRAADCEFIPKIQVTLNDADLEAARKLCDKLAETPDVVRLYDNIA